MSRRKKIILSLGILLLVFIGAIFFLNWYIVKQLEKKLEAPETNLSYEYDEISVNVLTGNASALKVLYKNDNIEIKAEEVLIRDLSYYNYLVDGKFQIGELEIKEPIISYWQNEKTSDSLRPDSEDSGQNIRIKNIRLTNGAVRIFKDSTSENLFLKFKKLALSEFLSDKNIRRENLPFSYEDLELESDSLVYNLNEEHLISIENINFRNKNLELKNFSLIPKFSVAEFDQRIPYEKDRIHLKVELIGFRNLNWKIIRDSLEVVSPLVSVQNAQLEVYRNKLLPDDTRIKPLYSGMIRNLGLNLDLDSIRVRNMEIVYKEKVKKERPPGILKFGNVQAVIENFSNMADSTANQKTKITAEALFMNKAPLTMNLEFDVKAPNDAFHVSGRMGAVKAETLNPFLKPAMNVETVGVINSMYYDFNGNKISAKGNMKLAYEDFKVKILKEGKDSEKSFLTAMANLFIKNKAVNEKVNQDNLEITRDQTKSFWNFLWLCIREGAIKSLI